MSTAAVAPAVAVNQKHTHTRSLVGRPIIEPNKPVLLEGVGEIKD